MSEAAPDLFEHAARARDAGMAQAAEHAERVEPRFTERAYEWICEYAKAHRRFVSEECTNAAAEAGLRSPTDPRAWGHPFRRAARENIIRRAGFGVSARRHLSPTILWESLIQRS